MSEEEAIECFDKLIDYCETNKGFVQNYMLVLLKLVKQELFVKNTNKRTKYCYMKRAEYWLDLMAFCEYMAEFNYYRYKDGLDEWLLDMERQIREGTNWKRTYTKKK